MTLINYILSYIKTPDIHGIVYERQSSFNLYILDIFMLLCCININLIIIIIHIYTALLFEATQRTVYLSIYLLFPCTKVSNHYTRVSSMRSGSCLSDR